MEYKKLKDLVEMNSENINKNYKECTINYLDTSNITEGRIDNIIELKLNDAPSRAKRIVRKNDIIYSTVRPNLCHYGILRKTLKNMVVSTGFVVLRCKKEILPEYLYAYITLPSNTKKLQAIAETSTSAYPSITKEDLEELDIPLPAIEIQEKIAVILSNIDKKIELNNQINNNLYEIIETYYKEKYINNSKKHLCKMNTLIEETVGGDWGKDKPTGNYNQEVICIRGADIPEMDKGNKRKTPNRFILEKNLRKKRLTGNEIVIEISGGSPTQSTGRSVYITPILEQSFKLPVICTNFCKAIRLKDKKYLAAFYMNLRYLYNKNIMFLYENGTTGIKNLDLNSLLENEEINILSENENNIFNSLFYNINNIMVSNSEENTNLEQLRDILVAKLMNGEIDLDKIKC